MYGYYYKAGKSWDVAKLWEATKDNPQENINVESFLKQDNYWNIGSFMELAKEMQLVLKADYSYPIILDEEYKVVDGAHRLVHAYIDGKTQIRGVIIRNDQWPEPDYDETKECLNRWKPSNEKGKETKNDKVMKANKVQNCLCDVIHSQADFWKHSNDITSPTHLNDIEEECFAQLGDLISDEDKEEFQDKLKDLYWFIRKFD